jgi:hypothetical protein
VAFGAQVEDEFVSNTPLVDDDREWLSVALWGGCRYHEQGPSGRSGLPVTALAVCVKILWPLLKVSRQSSSELRRSLRVIVTTLATAIGTLLLMHGIVSFSSDFESGKRESSGLAAAVALIIRRASDRTIWAVPLSASKWQPSTELIIHPSNPVDRHYGGAERFVRATTPSLGSSESGKRVLMPTPINRDHLRRLLDGAAQLVEVLPADEYAEEHLPGAVNIPLKQLDGRTVQALDPTRPVVVYCWDGL